MLFLVCLRSHELSSRFDLFCSRSAILLSIGDAKVNRVRLADRERDVEGLLPPLRDRVVISLPEIVAMYALIDVLAIRRVEWRREQFRSAASVVSALSSFVANGHQTMPSFPPPPLKFRTAGFPQYGFKLAPASAIFTPGAYRPPLCLLSERGVCSVVGFRQTAPHPSDRTTSPVALGSASGCSVRQPHRLLWPHPSFCAAPPVSVLLPADLTRRRRSPLLSVRA